MNERISLFGCEIDPLRMPEAVAQVLDWVEDGSQTCRYVVTPNVDHTVMLQEREDFRRAYADAALVLADGMPVVLASRILGKSLPERVTGTDLVYALFETCGSRGAESPAFVPEPELALATAYGETSAGDFEDSLPISGEEVWAAALAETSNGPRLRVFLLGALPGVAQRAAAKIEARWPGVSVVGTYSPPLGFERDAEENHLILDLIADAQPDVLVVGLGAPKQELWVHAHRRRIEARVALCVGAAIDFLAEEKPRAPRWMRASGLEWLHRLLSEPRRLMTRYAKDAWRFPQIVWREWRSIRRVARPARATS